MTNIMQFSQCARHQLMVASGGTLVKNQWEAQSKFSRLHKPDVWLSTLTWMISKPRFA